MSWLANNLSRKLDCCFKYNMKMPNFNIIKNYFTVLKALNLKFKI